MTREKLRELARVRRDVGGNPGWVWTVQGFGQAAYCCRVCGAVNRCPIETQADETVAYCSTCDAVRHQDRVW